jgi:glycogen debranching enzyme
MPRPRLDGGGRDGAPLAAAYRSALRNLLDVNTVRYDPAVYDRTGLLADPPGTFVRAGGGYQQPWTRDAAVNACRAADLLDPVAARNTLWAVCERRPDGTLLVQQDNQWWDQVIWIVAAHDHALVTGDAEFLADAHRTGAATLRLLTGDRFDARFGLYRGPAYFQDGIAGYPGPPYDPAVGSSFVLDHPGTDELMCLSTNCLYYAAHLALADLAARAGEPAAAAGYRRAAAGLRAAINDGLWQPAAGSYGYFLDAAGAVAPYQETAGLAFAVLFGVAPPERAAAVLAGIHREPYGVVAVWPPFERFDEEHPGRHNAIVWPMVTALWGLAAARRGRTDLLALALRDVAGLAADGRFWELHHARTGAVDGGWQVGRQWPSEPDQTWSATGYLRLIHSGLFGLVPRPDGLRLAPRLPVGWGPVTLHDLPYRGASLTVTLTGAGSRIRSSTVDGRPARPVLTDLTGPHHIEIDLT